MSGRGQKMGPSLEKLGRCGQGPEVIGAGLFHFLRIRVLSLAALAGTGWRGFVSGVGVSLLKRKEKSVVE